MTCGEVREALFILASCFQQFLFIHFLDPLILEGLRGQQIELEPLSISIIAFNNKWKQRPNNQNKTSWNVFYLLFTKSIRPSFLTKISVSLYCRHPLYFSVTREVSPSRLYPSMKDDLFRCDFRTVRTCCNCINGNFKKIAVKIMPNMPKQKSHKI